jgi:hypothetical protein
MVLLSSGFLHMCRIYFACAYIVYLLFCFVLFIVYFLHSSEDTRSRAKMLAEEIGSFHFDVPIDSVVSAFLSLFERLTGKRPLYKVALYYGTLVYKSSLYAFGNIHS